MAQKTKHNKRIATPKPPFRGYVSPEDALTIGQAEHLSDALRQQRDFYIGEMHAVSRKIPCANGRTAELKGRMQELSSMANSLSFMLSQDYFSGYFHSKHPNAQLCVPLDSLLQKIEQEIGDVELAVEIIGKAIYDWTKTQYGNGGVKQAHTAINKIRHYAQSNAGIEGRMESSLSMQASYS